MRIFLAAGERFWEEFECVGVRFALLSYYHLRHNEHLRPMLAYYQRLCASSTERTPASVFCDSGVFAFKSGAARIADSTLQNYVESYAAFLGRDDTQFLPLVAEVDYYQDLEDADGKVLQTGKDRVESWREALYDVVGPRLVPVMVPELTWDEREELCADERFEWVAMASIPGDDPDVVHETMRHVNLAHRYGKRIHLFGQTNTQTNFKWFQGADSCDSTTWVGAQRHGMTFMHTRGRLDILDHEAKYRRKFYKRYYAKIGCDYETIIGEHRPHERFCEGPDSRTGGCPACAEQARENRRSALIAWRDYAAYVERRTVTRDRDFTMTDRPTQNPVAESPNLRPKIRKTWRGRGVMPLYEEFGGYSCPVYRNRPEELSENLTCQTCENFDMCKHVDEAEARNVREQREVSAVRFDVVPMSGDGVGERLVEERHVAVATCGVEAQSRGSTLRGDDVGGSACGGDRDDQADGGRGRPPREEGRGATDESGDRGRSSPIVRRKRRIPRDRVIKGAQLPLSQHAEYGSAVRDWLAGKEPKFDEETLARRAGKGSKEKDGVRVPNSSQATDGTGSGSSAQSMEVGVGVSHDSCGPVDGGDGVEGVRRVQEPESPGDGAEEGEGSRGSDDKTHLPVIAPEGAVRALGVLRRVTPNFTCDTCSIEMDCPRRNYASGEICFYKAPLDALDSRDPEALVGILEALVDMRKDRVFMALIQERVQTGGQIDPRVSREVDSFEKSVNSLLNLKLDLNGAKFEAEKQGKGVTVNVVQNSVPSEPGVVSRLFAKPLERQPAIDGEVV